MSIFRLASIPALLALAACGDTQGMRPNIALQNPGMVPQQPLVTQTAYTSGPVSLVIDSVSAVRKKTRIIKNTYVGVSIKAEALQEGPGFHYVENPDFEIQLCKSADESTCHDYMRIGMPSRWQIGDSGWTTTYAGTVGGAYLAPSYPGVTPYSPHWVQPTVDFSTWYGRKGLSLKIEAKDWVDPPYMMAQPNDFNRVRVRAFLGSQVGAWSPIVAISFVN